MKVKEIMRLDKILLVPVLPLVFCGCFLQLADRSQKQGGIVVARNMRGEPAFALSSDPASGRSFFLWTSPRSVPGSRFGLTSADPRGETQEIWRSTAAGTGGAVQFEPGLALSSSSLYAKWVERASGELSVKLAVYDMRGGEAPEAVQLSGLFSRVRNRSSMIPSGKNSVFLAWEDFNPAIRVPFAGVAEVGPEGLRWKRLLGNRTPGEEYLSPAITRDGADGLFVAARLIHHGDRGIVLNHFAPGGASWGDDAQANTFMGYQSGPIISPDGRGGVFLIWEDGRNGDTDIYGQELSSAGVAMWGEAGSPLVAAEGNQWNPVLVPDGAGGFFCAWIDDDMGTKWKLLVQRIDKDGRPLWGQNGVQVYPSDSRQSDLSMVPDGAGGVILSWNEPRYGYLDVFAQRFSKAGARLWREGGVHVTAGNRDQAAPIMVPDGNGGGLIAWKVQKGSRNWEIRAQRLNADGTPLWPVPRPARP